MMIDEARLIAATAALARTLPVGQREAFLAFAAESVRSTLMRVHATMSSSETEARVRAHIDAVRARLR